MYYAAAHGVCDISPLGLNILKMCLVIVQSMVSRFLVWVFLTPQVIPLVKSETRV